MGKCLGAPQPEGIFAEKERSGVLCFALGWKAGGGGRVGRGGGGMGWDGMG